MSKNSYRSESAFHPTVEEYRQIASHYAEVVIQHSLKVIRDAQNCPPENINVEDLLFAAGIISGAYQHSATKAVEQEGRRNG